MNYDRNTCYFKAPGNGLRKINIAVGLYTFYATRGTFIQ